MMTCSIFDVFDYCEEWKIFYCDKRFVSEEANIRMKESFKRKQVEHWLKLFKKKTSNMKLPKEYNTIGVVTTQPSLVELFHEYVRCVTDALNSMNELIKMIKLWQNYPEYYKEDKYIDFYTDLRDFLTLKIPLERFLWSRLYNDEWNDSLTYECFYDLIKLNKLNRNMTMEDIRHVVYDWFLLRKRRLPSHDHVYWISNDIEDMYTY